MRRKFKLTRNWTETLKDSLAQTLEWDQEKIPAMRENKPPSCATVLKIHEWDRTTKLWLKKKSAKLILPIKSQYELVRGWVNYLTLEAHFSPFLSILAHRNFVPVAKLNIY